uniref:Uncharacterized protein n=1 Tax=Kalanchoe fedtschenkoi TaxID=63787 RepID=A0A7N1A5I5_KALFE
MVVKAAAVVVASSSDPKPRLRKHAHKPFLLSLAAPSINRSSFLGHAIRSNRLHLRPPRTSSSREIPAKFNLYEILGGRGLCNGEKGLQLELQRKTATNTNSESDPESETQPDTQSGLKFSNLPDDSFDKEFLGLTGGFPGGEKGLRKFIESNPPPPKPKPGKKVAALSSNADASGKPKAPELPLLMPGMIAVKMLDPHSKPIGNEWGSPTIY